MMRRMFLEARDGGRGVTDISVTASAGSRMLRLVLSLLGAAVLAGCVSTAPKKTEPAAREAIVVSAEARADFDAAMALIKVEDYKGAIELLNKVVANSQTTPVPYVNLGIAHAKLGNLKEAEENFKRALELEPNHPVAGNEYAMIYRKTGRFAEARQLYEQILAQYPNYPLAHKNLGILCDIYLRDYACALKGYEAYSKALPEDKTVKMWIADVQRRVGK